MTHFEPILGPFHRPTAHKRSRPATYQSRPKPGPIPAGHFLSFLMQGLFLFLLHVLMHGKTTWSLSPCKVCTEPLCFPYPTSHPALCNKIDNFRVWGRQKHTAISRPLKARSHSSQKGRGPTRCLFLNDLADGVRILIRINKLGQPVGPESSKLSSLLGMIVQNVQGHRVEEK